MVVGNGWGHEGKPGVVPLRKKASFRGDNHHAAVVFQSQALYIGCVDLESVTGFDRIVDQGGNLGHGGNCTATGSHGSSGYFDTISPRLFGEHEGFVCALVQDVEILIRLSNIGDTRAKADLEMLLTRNLHDRFGQGAFYAH